MTDSMSAAAQLRPDAALLGLAVVQTLMASRLLVGHGATRTSPEQASAAMSNRQDWIEAELLGALAATDIVACYDQLVPTSVTQFLR